MTASMARRDLPSFDTDEGHVPSRIHPAFKICIYRKCHQYRSRWREIVRTTSPKRIGCFSVFESVNIRQMASNPPCRQTLSFSSAPGSAIRISSFSSEVSIDAEVGLDDFAVGGAVVYGRWRNDGSLPRAFAESV